MTRKTLKRQRKQWGGDKTELNAVKWLTASGGYAENQEDVKKGLDDVVTYFLYEIQIKNEQDEDAEDFLKHGEKERKALVFAYYEYGADNDAKIKYDQNIMIAIALLRYYMFDDQVLGPLYPDYSVIKYGVFDSDDLKHRRNTRPGINRTEEVRKAAKKFSLIQPNHSTPILFKDMEMASRIYKALDPEEQKGFISQLFGVLQKNVDEDADADAGTYEDADGAKIKGKVKVIDGITTIDIARGHLLGELEKKEEPTLLEYLNTFDNALWFIILYIFSVVKFSYKDIDRGIFLRNRIKLREKETHKFRKDIIDDAENLLRNSGKGEQMIKLSREENRQALNKMETEVPPIPRKKGGTRKRQKRSKK